MLSTSLLNICILTLSIYHATLADITSNLLPNTQVCGLQSIGDHVTAHEVDLREFPWSALLEYKREGKESTLLACGGTLISNKYVVTAAHCVKGIPQNLKLINVRLGEHTVSNASDCTEGTTECSDPPLNVDVDKIIIHNGYTGRDRSHSNDIALIKLKEAVNFSDYIKPICIPTGSKLLSNKYEGSVMTLVGWGTTKDSRDKNVKRKIEATGKTTEECNSVYNPLSVTIDDTQLCASSTNDFCNGNGGSSLAIQDNGNWYITGITSFGAANCQPDFPTIYTRASSFAQWIVDNLEE